MIGVFSLSAVLLSQDHRQSVRRWACIVGLCAQPAWFYATWKAGQWGIFALSFVYAALWLRGFYNFWLRGRSAWSSVRTGTVTGAGRDRFGISRWPNTRRAWWPCGTARAGARNT